MSLANAFLPISSAFLSLLSPSGSLSLVFRLPALTPRVISRKTIFPLMCVGVCTCTLPVECAAYLRGCMIGVRCVCVCVFVRFCGSVCHLWLCISSVMQGLCVDALICTCAVSMLEHVSLYVHVSYNIPETECEPSVELVICILRT